MSKRPRRGRRNSAEALVVHATLTWSALRRTGRRKNGACVLVVDDDPAIRRLIVATLKRDGYEFLEAPNGREALDLMRTDHPTASSST